MIQRWIDSYRPNNLEASEQALREIMQIITLSGLYKAGFFKVAAFYGGTALRLFYGLNRFSEDLDFSLFEKDKDFSLNSYLNHIVDEFGTFGIKIQLKEKKNRSRKSNIDSAFLKSDTIWNELIFESANFQINSGNKPSIKIKIEVDTQPPLGFTTEQRLLLNPYSFYVNCFTIDNLFAGKMHALLFRKWLNRVKGRDWYDLEWYIKNGYELNSGHFCIRANESKDWSKPTITKDELYALFQKKLKEVNMEKVKDDIKRFIPDDGVLAIWSEGYFKDLFQQIKFKA